MSKLTDDLRACDPIASPNVAGILMDTAAGRIEALEKSCDVVKALLVTSRHYDSDEDRDAAFEEISAMVETLVQS